MNYFAHGRHYVHDPYFLAGTAVPDWLGVVDRRVRVRSRQAGQFVDDHDPRHSAIARGILQHLHDDDWFHGTRAFAELSLELTRNFRRALPADEGFRPHFLGHILVEMLLDAALVSEEPARLEAYYAAVDAVEARSVEEAVNRMATRPTQHLAALIPLFSRERFLSDYQDDAKLLFRVNQVMRRVRLPLLPAEFAESLAPARRQVAARRNELLNP